ncbi:MULTISPECIES: riboflavin kinase [Actinoplanes]|uniref:riboflavin kinase n=1 Tax=Actinoplanes TaxID=1865 RepID=UPI0006984EA0|nr:MULTISPECIES: riboflavin kinase [Actinoplanes]GLY02082.1 hypothetical protein Acsp01_24610 [Actinoplanes sp. NBRC 101535]
MTISGEIIRGAGRGRPMGFPTANVDVTDPAAVPADGVWFGNFTLGDWTAPALVSVGTNPTFGPGARTVEAYVLDRDEDMYGQIAQVEILTLIRLQVRFDGVPALIEAMRADERIARRLADGETVPDLPWSP